MNMLAILFAAAGLLPQPVVNRVSDDAHVIDRVAEVSKGDIPADLLRRLVGEDIDLLRGKRPDGTYQYAGFERLEAGRISRSFSIDVGTEEQLKRVDVKGDFVYRAILDMPSRRLVVRHNTPVFVDRIEIEYMPQGTSVMKTQVVKIGAWLEPGAVKPVELDEIGRQATVRVFARADKAKGYGNIGIVLLQAKVVDNSDSPYADAVDSEKAILRALDHNDTSSIRSMAQRIVTKLGGTAPAATVEVTASAAAPAATQAPAPPAVAISADGLSELQAIEDLLTGTDAERRQGMDRFHQLIRRLRGR
jgi:hypothetical protein